MFLYLWPSSNTSIDRWRTKTTPERNPVLQFLLYNLALVYLICDSLQYSVPNFAPLVCIVLQLPPGKGIPFQQSGECNSWRWRGKIDAYWYAHCWRCFLLLLWANPWLEVCRLLHMIRAKSTRKGNSFWRDGGSWRRSRRISIWKLTPVRAM